MRRLCLALILLLAGTGAVQAQSDTTLLTGTLAKLHQSGVVSIGYRESSIPFSYLSARGEPIGYTIDLCKLVVDAIADELGRSLAIKWVPVTSESRIPAVASGQIDLECGSTTNNLDRQKQVAFSPTFFVSGTKLLVRKDSPIRSFRDLAGKRVVVTAGTTNEKTMRELATRFKIDMALSVAADHTASYAQLAGGGADAFATDDVLLFGLLAQNKAQADYTVVGDFLSYDPYGVMFRKEDPAMARLLNDTFHELAENGEIERRYERWFLRKLPSGVSLDLTMSPQLQTLLQTMAAHTE